MCLVECYGMQLHFGYFCLLGLVASMFYHRNSTWPYLNSDVVGLEEDKY